MTKLGIFVFLAGSALRAGAGLDGLPLRFEPNLGQGPAGVDYLSRGPGYSLGLSAAIASFEAGQSLIHMRLAGASAKAAAIGEGKLPGLSHYLLGDSPARWQTAVPQFSGVRFKDVYPGIDIVYYGNPQLLEYDFHLKPGADPASITLEFGGVRRLLLDGGDLLLETDSGLVRQKAPAIYQKAGSQKTKVAGSYRLAGRNRVQFDIGPYDRKRPLVIDPVLLFSTFYGGQQREEAKSIGLDAQGNVYVAGLVTSRDFPVTPGVVQSRVMGVGNDLFLVKLNSTGTAVLYATVIGGFDDDTDAAMAVAPNGEVFLAGTTRSADFPTTSNALLRTPAGGTDGFVLKLNTTGSSLIYSTRIGARGNDAIHAIGIDSGGNAFLAGETDSPAFPTTADVFQTERKGPNDCFVIKLNAAGSAFLYSTLLGGDADSITTPFESARAIAVDRFGFAHVGGFTTLRDFPIVAPAFQPAHFALTDGFLAKLNEMGSALAYSTFLGGEGMDQVNALALDASGNLYATGSTTSGRFPVTPQAFRVSSFGGTAGPNEAWVTKLNANGEITYSTYLGGGGDEQGNGIVADAAGNAYIIGTTSSSDFPITIDAIQLARAAGTPEPNDAFITQLDPIGQRVPFATYFGGTRSEIGSAITRDNLGNLYVAGFTQSRDFPLTPNAIQATTGFGTSTAFIARIGDTMRAPARLVIVSGNNQTANQDTVLPELLVVEVRDQFNAPLRNITVAFSATNGTVITPAANTGINGRAAVQFRLGNRAGAATVTATFTGLTPVTFNFTVIRVGPPLPAINTSGVVGGALSTPPLRQLAPLGIATVFGENFAPAGTSRSVGTIDLVDGKLPTNFAGVCVTINGTAARIFSVNSTQINLQVPENASIGEARVIVIINCGQAGELRSDEERVDLLSVAPELFLLARGPSGQNHAAVVNALNGALIGPAELVPGAVPARPNDQIIVFGTGFGATNPPIAAGELATAATPTLHSPVVLLDGQELPAENVLYVGITPGLAGVYQMNLRLPSNLRNGNLRLTVRFGSQNSPPGVVLRVAGGVDLAPLISVSPTRIEFGDVIAGSSRDLPLTIANAGTFPLTIQEIRTPSAVFSISPAGGFRIQPGEQRIVSVRFSPTSLGQNSVSLLVRSDDERTPEIGVALVGNGVAVPPPPNPAPSIASINPTSVLAGGAGFNIVINGAGFIRSSVVEWNGQPRSTFFNHGGQLIAFITTADIAVAGVARLTVFNPEPGGGRSAPSLVTIQALQQAGPSLLLNQIETRGCPEISTFLSVLNQNGAPVTSLAPTAFACSEDGQPINCLATAAPDTPLSIVLVLGLNGLSTVTEETLLRTAARNFIFSLSGQERIAVIHLETESRPLLPFTDDHNQVVNLIDQLRPFGDGNALLDAVGQALNLLRGEERRRHAVVLITPRGTTSGILRDPGQVLGSASLAGSPFFTFAVGANSGDVNLTGLLRQLSRDTGGQLVTENSELNYGRMLQNMAAILRNQYGIRHSSRVEDLRPHTLGVTALTPEGQVSATRSFSCPP
jgi:uncharacterized protein (TIGR03437 family)